MSRGHLRHEVRNHIIKSLVFTLVAGGIAYYLFCPAGPFFKYLNVDLSFLLPPFLGYYCLQLLSRLSGDLIRPRLGLVIACVLNGAAFSVFSYLFFDRAVLLTHIPTMAGAQGVLFAARQLALYSILFFTGYTTTKLSGLLRPTSWEGQVSPGIAALGQILMGCSLWQGFAVFAPYWSPFNGIGLILLMAMLAVAFSNIGAYGEESASQLLADACGWLRASAVGKFLLGALLAAYLVFIRPAIFSHFSYAFLIEWIIMCFAAWRILSGIRGGLQKYSLPIKEAAWQKHIQRVNDIADDDFDKLAVFQEDFVEAGSRYDLTAYLKQMLLDNGLNEAEINQTLQQVIAYSDRKIPWYAFWFWRRRMQRFNRNSRRSALDNMVQNLGKIAHPVRRKL